MSSVFKIILIIGIFSGFSGISAQEVRAPGDVAATDSVYRSLLAQEKALKASEDSLLNVVREQRLALRADTTDRYRRSQQILRAEEVIFELRNQLGLVVSRINAIQQQRILDDLFKGNGTPGKVSETTSTNYANLIDNAYFKDNLTPEEYAGLREAESRRASANSLAATYKRIYGELEEIAVAYAQAETQSGADSVYRSYGRKMSEIRQLDVDFQDIWGEYYDQEIYIYSYLLDKLNRTTDLAALHEKAMNAQRETAGKTMSESFASYPAQYQLLSDYQLALARALSLSAARDSLERARRSIPSENLSFPEIEIAERDFIAFQDISFPDVSPYNAQHPIPEMQIPESGTCYSVTVGSFTQRQAVSIFRGAVPLAYERTAGRWRYYAGLFRSYEEAVKAVGQLRDAGFRRPEPVRWIDGKYENLAAGMDKIDGFYRIRIETADGEMHERARTQLERYARSKEITRVGTVFYVGTFTHKIQVDEVMDALRKIDGVQAEAEKIEE